MRARLKNIIERLTGYRIWIGYSAERARVERLLRQLRVRPTVAPLVRVGPKRDGGYLLPDDLDGISACVSPGVNFEVGFDKALAERGIDVHMVDGSVAGPPEFHERFHFTRKFLDVFEDDSNVRLDTLCAGLPEQGDLLLQMDIEGAEWRVLMDTSPETLRRFRIMVVEFHNLREVFGQFSFEWVQAVFAKLLQSHSVVHLHPNNCAPLSHFADLTVPQMMEFTFYRKDRAFAEERPMVFPHVLDADNVVGRPSVVLPRCWQA